MINLEPASLCGLSSEECAGIFVFRGPKRITQNLELSPEYLEVVCKKTHLDAEQELMLAVLEDAVTCFQKYFAARDKIGTRLFCEAEEWVLLQRKSDWFFSFDNICETLDLNPGYIREGLLHWRDHQLREQDRVQLRVGRSRYASRN